MRTPCPNANEECKYFDRPPIVEGEDNGCFADKEHIYPRRLGSCAISRAFIGLSENHVQMCRDEHDAQNHYEQTTGETVNPLPPTETMIQTILESGQNVSRRARQAIAREQALIEQARQKVMNAYWQDKEMRRV